MFKEKPNTHFYSNNDDIDFILWRFLNHAAFMINRSRQKELAQYGVTPEQAYVLDILHHSKGTTTIHDIVNITLRQHNSISTLVGRMAIQGLVKKERSGSDGRQYNVTITPKGEELFQSITRDSIKDIFSCLTDEERQQLDKALKKLMAKAYQALSK